MKEEIRKIFREKERRRLFLLITIFSFILFFALTLTFSFSRFLLFNYFLKEAIGIFLLTTLIIFIFSISLALVSVYLIKNYENFISNKKLFFIFMFILFIVSFVLMLGRTSYSIFSYTEMNGFWFSFINFILLAPLISLSSFFTSQLPIIFKAAKGSGGTIGFITGLFSMGCPSCGAILYSLLGVTAGLSLFPFKGLEIRFISLALLIFSTYNLNKSIKEKERFKNTSMLDIPNFGKGQILFLFIGLALVFALLIFNQISINAIKSNIASVVTGSNINIKSDNIDLSGVGISQLKSTAMTIASVFPELKQARSEDDVVAIMLPSGIPPYSNALGGISFDDPVNSLNYLARWYYSLKDEVKQKYPEKWQRYLNLAAAPRGISCEFCCGVGPQGITKDGKLRCGCKHNPALQAIALGLITYTDYSDAEVLREVMKWKTIFFPKNMVALGLQVAGKEPSQIKNLPGMVGGC